MLQPLFRRIRAAHGFLGVTAQQLRQYGNKGSLHLTMEPLDGQHEGIFQITLTRPEARNAIGTYPCVDHGHHALQVTYSAQQCLPYSAQALDSEFHVYFIHIIT